MKRKEIIKRATQMIYGGVYNRILQRDVETMLEGMGFFDLLGTAEKLIDHSSCDNERCSLMAQIAKAVSKINEEILSH